MSKERILSLIQTIWTAFLVVLSARWAANVMYIEANIGANLTIGFLLAFLAGGAFVLWIKGD